MRYAQFQEPSLRGVRRLTIDVLHDMVSDSIEGDKIENIHLPQMIIRKNKVDGFQHCLRINKKELKKFPDKRDYIQFEYDILMTRQLLARQCDEVQQCTQFPVQRVYCPAIR